MAEKESRCREIVTKAVCGKGRKFSQVTHNVVPPNKPTSILGAWIINHQYEAAQSGESVDVIGTYDINIWYSYDKNTKTDVAKETISYSEIVPLSYLDPKHRTSTEEVSAEATQEPNCVEASVSANGQSVKIRVEREFEAEMIAETKVCVMVCDGGCDDFDDKSIDFGDSISDDFEDLDDDLLDEDVL